MEFKPTHRITFTPVSGEPIVYEVQLDADNHGLGPAYDREEWKACDAADWELNEDGWEFHGQATPNGAPGYVSVTPLLAALVGSQKQIAWATDERKKIIAELDRHVSVDRRALKEHKEHRSSYETDDQRTKTQDRLTARLERDLAAIVAARQVTSARAWIDLLRTQPIDNVIKILTTDEGQKILKKYIK